MENTFEQKVEQAYQTLCNPRNGLGKNPLTNLKQQLAALSAIEGDRDALYRIRKYLPKQNMETSSRESLHCVITNAIEEKEKEIGVAVYAAMQYFDVSGKIRKE